MGGEADSDGRGRAPEVDPELDVAMARFQACSEQRDQALAARVLEHDYALVLVHPAPALMPRAPWLEVLPAHLVHS